MVEGLPAELPIVDVAARLGGKSSELPENGASLKNAEGSQGMGGDCTAELPLHEGKEVILVDDNDSEQEDDGSGKVDENVPRVGLRFKTYDDALKYYKQYAADSGFSAIILKSSYLKSGVCRRLVLGCSRAGRGRANACYLSRESTKINCPARISLKLRQDRWLHIDDAKLDHNHPPNQSSVSPMNCYKKLTDAKNEETASRSKGRRNVPIGDKEQGSFTEIGRLKFGEGDDEYIYKFFGSMQNKNPDFFYLVDLDKQGRLRNLFWSDAKSQVADDYFGRDVVYFDTSYLTEKYDLPLVFFTGVNNHGQTVLFGTGLLSDLGVDSYVWLFRAFFACMKGCYPAAIITEHYNAILDAVRDVLPQVKHRLCLYRIMKDVTENLKAHAEFKTIKKALKKVTYGSLKAPEFEADWKKIIEEHGLGENECLSSLYEHRHLWAPAYLKDQFWAGISVSQRGESIVSYYDGFVYPKTSLKQFFSKYEIILENKYKKELQADEESSHRTPLTVTKFYMEEQLAKEYTISMFKKFQDELKATMYCDGMPTKVDGQFVTFEVKECSYMEDGKETESRNYEVYFCKQQTVVECECGFFQFTGILCRHVLSVLKLQEMFEIPSRFVLDRWKRDYKNLHASARYRNDEMIPAVLPDGIIERHDNLFAQSRQVLKLGFISENRYLVALKLLRQAEKTLLDDGLSRDRQPGLLSFEAEAPENDQGLFSPEFSEGVKNSQSTNAKRRGRPTKKLIESNSDTVLRPNKEQDFLRSSFVTDESNMIQGAPSASHLESPHMGVQGSIDLMEGISPNLSFNPPFGMDVNHQQQVPTQPRMLPNNFLQAQADSQGYGNQWAYPTLQDNSILRTAARRGV
ncbi:protein FAR1-RELATED SEQUENCE 6-like [Oryza brachyantha]|uniref:Protein FAR1-RELATED SEQUENCE n=1 Tax=Oryza brachyantha TaxID=4533 RepID=J3KUH8_ORYBR|nr:protein FAR1-RELATED SEQUENCE 6-like [Oryza brachyantha]XP_015698941.1 protein FAR1-RELATED SEQUENCE 6-like [Oryza brachyantha]XP_040376501.1 protein FAR1-RELATED SEQUENCE 6-like [Oryza brachyantha]